MKMALLAGKQPNIKAALLNLLISLQFFPPLN